MSDSRRWTITKQTHPGVAAPAEQYVEGEDCWNVEVVPAEDYEREVKRGIERANNLRADYERLETLLNSAREVAAKSRKEAVALGMKCDALRAALTRAEKPNDPLTSQPLDKGSGPNPSQGGDGEHGTNSPERRSWADA